MKKGKQMEHKDPLEVLEELTKQKAKFTATFHDEYESCIEVLQLQLFEPNGYKLVVIENH